MLHKLYLFKILFLGEDKLFYLTILSPPSASSFDKTQA